MSGAQCRVTHLGSRGSDNLIDVAIGTEKVDDDYGFRSLINPVINPLTIIDNKHPVRLAIDPAAVRE